MKRLVVWAHSYCRSTLAFYASLANALNRALVIYTWQGSPDIRNKVGFSPQEFSNLDIQFVGDNYQRALNLLKNEDAQSYHIFAAYQSCSLHRKLMDYLIERDIRYCIASEAPCNMASYPNRAIKDLYFHYYLPIRLRKYIQHADNIVNFSGYYEKELLKLGWQKKQIISCGYFPPRIKGSQIVKRTEANWKNFTILLTGLHEWHRSPWLLLQALTILKEQHHLEPKCYITQNGPYLRYMKEYVQKHHLKNVSFLGFVEMHRLIELYETCSVYIGTGNYEPWGMRLNDVLLCGAPIIVNRGMGGVKLVDEYLCGLSFKRKNSFELAQRIMELMTNQDLYLKVAENAFNAASIITPEIQAKHIAKQLTIYLNK